MACCSSIGRTLVVGASWAIVSSFRGAIVIQTGNARDDPAEIRHLTPEFGFCSEAASCSSSSQMWLSAAPGGVIGGDAVCVFDF